MRLMNQVLQQFICHSVIVSVLVYLDDILIYSRSEEEYMVHLSQVFQVFCDNKIFFNLKKCTFLSNKVIFWDTWYQIKELWWMTLKSKQLKK